MAELLQRAGLPDGVFNVVQGDKVVVDALLAHPDVKAVSFVGSTPIAHYIYETGAHHGKRVQALGGAKNHMVVMPDADIEQAVDALIGAAYGSAGERCMAISVAVLVGDVADRLVPALAERATHAGRQERHGTRRRDGPDRHAARRCERIEGYIASGVEEGATLVVDGRGLKVSGPRERLLHRRHAVRPRHAGDAHLQGRDLRPGARLRARARLRATPSTSSTRTSSATAWPASPATATSRASSRAASRSAWSGINVPIPVPMAWHGFGGWKKSLFGDMHAYGEEGVRFYTKQKIVMQRWPASIGKGAEFAMPTAK